MISGWGCVSVSVSIFAKHEVGEAMAESELQSPPMA